MTIVLEDEEHESDSPPVTEADLRTVLEQASRASAHTVLDRVRSGYVTIRGGHRIGLCGEVVMKQGQIQAFGRLSSLSIRIAKQVTGVGGQALSGILDRGQLCSTLILLHPVWEKPLCFGSWSGVFRTVSHGPFGGRFGG